MVRSVKMMLMQLRGHLNTRTVAVAAMLLAGLLVPGVTPAVSLSGDSTTYLQSLQAIDGTREFPLYEYLNLSVKEIGKETVSFQFGGWLRYDLKGNGPESRNANDLSYAYLSYRDNVSNTVVNLGRVLVFEGVASDRVDGIYVKTDLKNNFSVSAFGGAPAETGNELTTTGNIYGTRVSHQMPGLYQVGLSYLKEEKSSTTFRKDEGIDLWLRPMNKVELMGKSRYNGETTAWSDHNYVLVLGPFSNVRLNTEASFINYKDFFTGTTTAAFKFDPTVINKNEKVHILGEEVGYDVTDKLKVSANFRTYAYEVAGDAKYYGANVRYSAPSGGVGISLHKMAGDTDRLKYIEYRAYGYRKYGKTDVTLDLLEVAYGSEISHVKNAYSATLGAAYELSERMKLGADMEYSKNPDFDKDIRTLVKLTYRFDTAREYSSTHAAKPSEPAAKPAAEQTPVVAPEQAKPAAAPEQVAPAAAPGQDKPKEGN
jgi:hypothetical protein